MTRAPQSLRPPVIPAETIRAKLRAMENATRVHWVLLMLAGGAVSMIGPVIFGTALWLRQLGNRGAGDVMHTWTYHVMAASSWFLPIMLLVEWLTRGKLLENTMEATEDMPDYAGRRAMSGAVLAEICLWGPRIIIAGFKKFLGMSRHMSVDRMLAAEMVSKMVARGESVSTGELMKLAQGNDDAFANALAYLMFHEVIDLSKSGDRAWVTSNGKRALRLEK